MIIPAEVPASQSLAALLLTTCTWRNQVIRYRVTTDTSGVRDKEPVWSKTLGNKDVVIREHYRYGTHTPGFGDQRGIICSEESGLIALDCDDQEIWWQNGIPANREMAFQTRDDHYHVLVDARAFRGTGLWPKQGRVRGGDVKSNGFIPFPGSMHYSGATYEPRLDAGGSILIIEATTELMEAICRARQQGPSLSGSGEASEGNWLELSWYTKRLWNQGYEQEEAFTLWLAHAQTLELSDPDWPWTADDKDVFGRQWDYRSRQPREPEWQSSLAAGWQKPKKAGKPATEVNHIRLFGHFKRSDLEIIDSSAVLKLQRKAYAEQWARDDLQREHRPNRKYSKDWETAPETAEAVHIQVLDACILGEPLEPGDPVFDMIDPGGEGRIWGSSGKHPLFCVLDGRVRAIADPKRKPNYESYPGWTSDRDPKAGITAQYHLSEISEHVASIYIDFARKNQRPTIKNVTEVINSTQYRDEHQLWVFQAFNPATIQRARQIAFHGVDPVRDTVVEDRRGRPRLVHDPKCRGCTGIITKLEREQRYREDHMWMCEPAKIVADPVTPELREWSQQFQDDIPEASPRGFRVVPHSTAGAVNIPTLPDDYLPW